MKPTLDDLWDKAGPAKDKLALLMLSHPQVSMIDIGSDPADREKGPLLRLHIRRPSDIGDLKAPDQIDGIPVIIVEGDYQPE